MFHTPLRPFISHLDHFSRLLPPPAAPGSLPAPPQAAHKERPPGDGSRFRPVLHLPTHLQPRVTAVVLRFSKHVDRLLEGIQLYHKGAIKTIILASDGSNRISDDPDDQSGNPIGMRKYIERLGVTPTDLILENKATTTRENAQFLLEQLGDSLKSARPLLITSAEHMRRAVMTFEQAGIPVDAYATDCIIKEKKPKSLFSLTVMNNWPSLLHELLGYLYYRLTI